MRGRRPGPLDEGSAESPRNSPVRGWAQARRSGNPLGLAHVLFGKPVTTFPGHALRLGQKPQACLRAQGLGVEAADLGGAAGLDGDDHRIARGRGRNDARALGEERGQLGAGAAARGRAVEQAIAGDDQHDDDAEDSGEAGEQHQPLHALDHARLVRLQRLVVGVGEKGNHGGGTMGDVRGGVNGVKRRRSFLGRRSVGASEGSPERPPERSRIFG